LEDGTPYRGLRNGSGARLDVASFCAALKTYVSVFMHGLSDSDNTRRTLTL